MSNDRPTDVLSALPRRRPHRRSEKRPAPAAVEASATKQAPPTDQPAANGSHASPKPAKPGSAGRTRGARPKAATSKPASPKRAAPGRTARTSDAGVGPSAQVLPARTRATRRRPERLPQPAQPSGVPHTSRASRPEPPGGRRLLGTAAQAAAELAEIGLSASARALRNAVARLPRP